MAVLILFAHPAFQKSRANRALADAVRSLDGVTFHDLYEAYPDMHIHVAREQQLLRAHDVVVFQHPFYWYSAPAILREWQDLVLEYDFAYGRNGDALRGKRTLNAVSIGGPESSYTKEGANRFTIRELLAPFEATARLCGMEFLEPFLIHGATDLSNDEIRAEAKRYRERIIELRDHNE
jgi:glutathione-regulated potassium-efflux system ancillary protein KefG